MMKQIPVKGLMSSWNGVSTWLVEKKSARGHFRYAGLKIKVCDTLNLIPPHSSSVDYWGAAIIYIFL
jgi:hypothetical protein